MSRLSSTQGSLRACDSAADGYDAVMQIANACTVQFEVVVLISTAVTVQTVVRRRLVLGDRDDRDGSADRRHRRRRRPCRSGHVAVALFGELLLLADTVPVTCWYPEVPAGALRTPVAPVATSLPGAARQDPEVRSRPPLRSARQDPAGRPAPAWTLRSRSVLVSPCGPGCPVAPVRTLLTGRALRPRWTLRAGRPAAPAGPGRTLRPDLAGLALRALRAGRPRGARRPSRTGQALRARRDPSCAGRTCAGRSHPCGLAHPSRPESDHAGIPGRPWSAHRSHPAAPERRSSPCRPQSRPAVRPGRSRPAGRHGPVGPVSPCRPWAPVAPVSPCGP